MQIEPAKTIGGGGENNSTVLSSPLIRKTSRDTASRGLKLELGINDPWPAAKPAADAPLFVSNVTKPSPILHPGPLDIGAEFALNKSVVTDIALSWLWVRMATSRPPQDPVAQ
ncbi:MAG: hypothetical protein HC909_00785 [Blastochloris sp.]|nr:hypothetical protein [Blastochloris sp.]